VLSNKKWDIALKGLQSQNLVIVEKDDAGFWVKVL